MKNLLKTTLVTTILITALNSSLMSQEVTAGKVVFERMAAYDFDVYKDNPSWEKYIKDLPKEYRISYTLTFNGESVLFQEDSHQKEQPSKKLQNALLKANYAKTPKPEVKQIFYDLSRQERTEQVEFMTRNFLLSSELTPVPWKLTPKRKKVLGYVCLGAEIKEGDDTITAWFSSEIPLSAGPESYYGLPGLILAVDRNDNTFILATEIDLSASVNPVSKPNKGRQMTQVKFEQLVMEKTEEFKNAAKAKKGDGSKGGIKKGQE